LRTSTSREIACTIPKRPSTLSKAPVGAHSWIRSVMLEIGTPGPPGSSRRAGGFSLVLPPTTADAGHRRQLLAVRLFHRPKRLTFGTRSSPRRKFLAGRRADGLRATFTRSSPQDSQVREGRQIPPGSSRRAGGTSSGLLPHGRRARWRDFLSEKGTFWDTVVTPAKLFGRAAGRTA
jgi:hypothetical protein